jgi:hypothetical protein
MAGIRSIIIYTSNPWAQQTAFVGELVYSTDHIYCTHPRTNLGVDLWNLPSAGYAAVDTWSIKNAKIVVQRECTSVQKTEKAGSSEILIIYIIARCHNPDAITLFVFIGAKSIQTSSIDEWGCVLADLTKTSLRVLSSHVNVIVTIAVLPLQSS